MSIRNIAAFLLFLQMTGYAATYHVAKTGDDGNVGSLASPWLTIQHAATNVSAGDTITVHAGTYRETVTPTVSGTIGNPITYQSATGESVVVSGANEVGSFVQASNDVFVSSLTWYIGRGSNQVFMDGIMIPEARWPNSPSVFTNVFYSITGGSTNNSASGYFATVEDSVNLAAFPDGYWSNATIIATWGGRYHANYGFVTNSVQTGGILQLTWGLFQNWDYTDGIYYLLGHTNALDTTNEWWINTVNTNIYIWFPGGNTNGHLVEVKARRHVFDLSGISNTIVTGMTTFAGEVLTDANSSNLRFTALTVSYPSWEISYSFPPGSGNSMGNGVRSAIRTSGIILNGLSNVIENSTIYCSSGNGISMIGNNCSATNCVINIANLGLTECSGIQMGYATTLLVPGSNCWIVGCTISNATRSCINHDQALKIHILGNELSYAAYGSVLWDLGVMYAQGTHGLDSEIAYNYIHDFNSRIGIYLDGGYTNDNWRIHHNVVANEVQKGFTFSLLINATGETNYVDNNTFCNKVLFNSSVGHQVVDSYFRNNLVNDLNAVSFGTLNTNNNIDFHSFTEQNRNALFIDWSNRNYRLPSTSKAVNAGAILGYTRDFDGNPILGIPDIGAFEFQGSPRAIIGTLNSKNLHIGGSP